MATATVLFLSILSNNPLYFFSDIFLSLYYEFVLHILELSFLAPYAKHMVESLLYFTVESCLGKADSICTYIEKNGEMNSKHFGLF